ncbi:MAG: hypothetical protein HY909_04280 [Deltaproteobacteria bacterium]|nr:hypothetical protein [Deltaproteobacteria bacterium]
MRAGALVAVAFALVVGCVPEWDTTGQLRCGVGGLCPAGLSCVSGRCCPVGGASGQCPVGVPDSGADAPQVTDSTADTAATPDAPADSAMMDAPTDRPPETCVGVGTSSCGVGSECREGVCCDVNAGAECPAGSIGSPCTEARDCVRTPGTSVICYRGAVSGEREEYPRGYCSSGCERTANPDGCGALGVCVIEGFFSACARRCAAGRSCREGYTCRPYNATLNRQADVCVPDCTRGAYCPNGQACYARGRTCRPACSTAMDRACPALTGCSPADRVCLQSCLVGCPPGTNCGEGLLCRAL